MTDSLPERARSLLPLLRRAAEDQTQIRGLTHCFYRYPARFSPTFAGAAIEAFSRPGQVVFDPLRAEEPRSLKRWFGGDGRLETTVSFRQACVITIEGAAATETVDSAGISGNPLRVAIGGEAAGASISW